MFSQNPNATPVWLLMIFSAVAMFSYPRVKKIAARFTDSEETQNFFSIIMMMAILAIAVTISVILFP